MNKIDQNKDESKRYKYSKNRKYETFADNNILLLYSISAYNTNKHTLQYKQINSMYYMYMYSTRYST